MVQVINLRRDNTLGDSILAAMQGYQSGQDRKMKQDEMSLARMKTMAEVEKMKRESEMLQNPGQIPINPNTGKPAGFVLGGKYQSFGGRTAMDNPPNIKSLYEVLSGVDETAQEENVPGTGGWFGIGAQKRKIYTPEQSMIRQSVLDQMKRYETSQGGEDPIIRTGVDSTTGKKVGQTQSGQIVPME